MREESGVVTTWAARGWAEEDGVGSATLRRLVTAWPRRAAVTTRSDALDEVGAYDPQLPDYPLRMVPFAEHPRFLAATPEQRGRVLTGLWIGYNERVIATEHLIAEPAFDLVMRGVFPGSDHPLVRQGVQQSLVDESFHTYMHMLAISRTRELRGVRSRPEQPRLVTHRRLLETLARMPEEWERDVAVLVWGAVAETCINSLLALLARDDSIQPLHSLITTLHLRDETAHGSLVIEVVRELYARMNAGQRRVLMRCLPLALEAFAEQDLSTLRLELVTAGIEGADEIVGDLRATSSGRRLVRDFSGAQRMIEQLELGDAVDFEFPEPPAWSPGVGATDEAQGPRTALPSRRREAVR
ncbi:diiron oxygenase [Streptomyces sp. NA04227]|uniref:4-aminobenzoate N-oxygenase n=1 Tax=Streptomyces sp. NA04227 TaxID=2742136 RepID=UPI00159027FB|nr:4-aminobenzoate N-oxygenase [Streptomyces sp. NA04227]QKW09723.1 diiron oxygenase [Streptomyces sp. NA04227]